MEEDFPAFSPDVVEQHITHLLRERADEETHSTQYYERKLVRDLQGYYTPANHQAALQRVWLRFLMQQQRSTQSALPQARIIHLARRRYYRWFQTLVFSLIKAKFTRYVGIATLLLAFALTFGRLVHSLTKHYTWWTRPDAIPSSPDST